MSDVFADADHELGVQLQILHERDATLHHRVEVFTRTNSGWVVKNML